MCIIDGRYKAAVAAGSLVTGLHEVLAVDPDAFAEPDQDTLRASVSSRETSPPQSAKPIGWWHG